MDEPKHLETFNNYMTGQRFGRASWLDFYPIERLMDGFPGHDDAVMLVDVGGGRGHEIREIKSRCPTLPGRMILQDLQEVLSGVTAAPNTEVMAHDFFAPQLIQGETRSILSVMKRG